MAEEVVAPPVSMTADEVTLVTWYKREGEAVKKGEPLFAVETDKAVLDIEAQVSGVLRRVVAQEGETVKVLGVIALIADPDEPLPELAPIRTITEKDARSHRPVLPPAARRPKTDQGARIFVSPRARRLALEKGVALEGLTPTGPEGAIVERDVRTYLETAVSAGPVIRRVQLAPEVLAHQPLQGIRALIARRMVESASTTAAVTLSTQADAGELAALRRRLAEAKVAVSYDDLLLWVLGQALGEYPALNASLQGQVLRQWKQVNIGVAVDTGRGLLAPVVREANTKGLAELAVERADIVERALSGTLTPNELRGGTFTLANLGMYDVDTFTPIINLPETAILGLGRIKPRPVVRQDEIVVREMVWLSLTFDHRLVDGAPAARFLQRVVQLIEQPYLLVAGSSAP